MITMHRQHIGALVRHMNHPQGALGAAFMDEPAAGADFVAQIAQWHASLPEAERIPPSVLRSLAAPALVADVRAALGRDTMIRTWAVCGDPSEKTLVLAAATGEEGDQLKLEWKQTREEFADSLLLWLLQGGETSEPEMKVVMSQAEFAVLLALCDLHSRAAYSAYLTHEPAPAHYETRFVQQAYEEAVTVDDPRWLLSFSVPLLDEEACRLGAPQVEQALNQLAGRGLIELSGAGVKWTVPGEYLAESLHRRQVMISLDTVASDPQGLLGTHAGLFIRSDQPLWYADIAGGGSVAITGVSLQAARDVLDAFFTPLGPPAPKRQAPPPAPAPPPPAAVEKEWYLSVAGQTEGPMPESALRARIASLPPGALVWNAGLPNWITPEQAGLAPQATVCRACGANLKPGQRFCVACGSPQQIQ